VLERCEGHIFVHGILSCVQRSEPCKIRNGGQHIKATIVNVEFAPHSKTLCAQPEVRKAYVLAEEVYGESKERLAPGSHCNYPNNML
jgi:hypothetical protein